MKNITVSVEDGLYHEARVCAAKRKTSLSALVRDYLTEIVEDESAQSEFDRLKRQEREIRESIQNFTASDRLNREEIHERNAFH